ncbi:hypothetical protein [Ectothiorhodospira lacustris]|uniref:hypothetical protein n=1 Tax=Ectothiorhodospira lacustris TaxID=2899127 RepID=UPI001EE7E780|nr:hypothetical protein [Ectothiorhodospira lacustris]MCG5509684.1 hypothetical protein [Ectothiorhodospira lacustris]MCG5523083.1 hypothetical protein [Ectothiorhodospira lacustris]
MDSQDFKRITFEKCTYESYLAFRGIGGKKPDEGRQDWANRFLKKESDPIPLGDAAGKLHQGSIFHAHYWVGQADETQYVLPENYDQYMERVKRYVRKEDWDAASLDWEKYQLIFQNHRKYQLLFSEFRGFLETIQCAVTSYEELYRQSEYLRRLEIMEGISQRSTIPNEDFEIVVAALLSECNAFVTMDHRLLKAAASIEANIKTCVFIHLDEVKEYAKSK